MEGRSERAFDLLGRVYEKVSVKVIRDGEVRVIPKEEVAVGDILLLETGDKVAADGRIIEANGLKTDESMLTGESMPVKKRADAIFPKDTALCAPSKSAIFAFAKANE